MYNIVLIGFGSIGYRYYQAIKNINLKKKLYIIDKKKIVFKKIYIQNKRDNYVKTSVKIKSLPKNIDLLILANTCNDRPSLLKSLDSITKFKNLIIEKPLTQSPKELIELNKILSQKKNCWVNTDRRILKVYRYIKKRINIKKKISMKVIGSDWGICCNSLHFVDLFNYFTDSSITCVKEKKPLKWELSKRKNFFELGNGELRINFGENLLKLVSKKNNLKKIKKDLSIYISNNNKFFKIKEHENVIELKFNKKIIKYRNEYLSVKMTKILQQILIKEKSNLPSYKTSSELYFPLIEFFLKKWNNFNKNSIKVPIT